MTQRTLSANAIAAINAESSEEVWIAFLTFEHPELDAPVRICSNNEDVTSGGHSYIGLPFELILPEESQDALGVADIRIPNVDRQLTAIVRDLVEPPTVRLHIALASSPNTVEMELDGLTLRDVTYDAEWFTGTLRFEDLLSEPVCEIATPDRFPALFALLISAGAGLLSALSGGGSWPGIV